MLPTDLGNLKHAVARRGGVALAHLRMPPTIFSERRGLEKWMASRDRGDGLWAAMRAEPCVTAIPRDFQPPKGAAAAGGGAAAAGGGGAAASGAAPADVAAAARTAVAGGPKKRRPTSSASCNGGPQRQSKLQRFFGPPRPSL